MKLPEFLKPPITHKKPHEDDLAFWRRSLFEKILYVFFIATSLVIVPSAWGGFAYGVPFVGVFDIFVYAAVSYFYFSKNLKLEIKHRIIELVYIVGVAVLYALGPEGAGFIWIIGYCTFSTILFGRKGTYRAYVLTILALVTIVVELHFGWFPDLKLHGFNVLTFSLTAINMLALSLMINASFNFILSRQQNLFIEQKQATKKFEDKSAELEKTNENLDNLVYSISHDIRSPLANIKGLADLGTRDATDDLLKSYFEKIDHSTEKLQHFTRMVTHFFMVDKAELKPVSIHLKHWVTSLFQDNYNDLLGASDSIRIDIPDNLVLNSDETRLTLILMNLFSNSIKYKAPERPLELKVAARNENSLIKLTIEDNGQGIDQDLIPRIFEMFAASDQSNAGSGLGLYIVSQCSKTLKGKINVVSEKNGFTRFEIDLPNLEA